MILRLIDLFNKFALLFLPTTTKQTYPVLKVISSVRHIIYGTLPEVENVPFMR